MFVNKVPERINLFIKRSENNPCIPKPLALTSMSVTKIDLKVFKAAGAKGGRAGRGAKKRRPKEFYRSISLKRWAKEKAKE